jgi:hypothetical protein
VSGALPAEERRELVDRTAADPGCAEAWRVARELWPASEAAIAGGPTAVSPGRAARRTLPWMAAAAALLLGTTIGLVSLLDRPRGDEFRASAGYVVESLVPADTALPRDRFRLRWTPGPEGSRYEVRVTTEDLQVVATDGGLTTPEFVVEAAVLSDLVAGAELFWQVNVALPDGERIASPTFVTAVE